MIWVVEALVGLVSGTARRHLHLAAITGLFTLLAVEVVKATTDLRGPRLAAIASAAGLLGGVLYASLTWPRLWLRFLAPAPLIFALLFLLASPTSALVLPARAPTAQGPSAVAASGERPPLVMILFDVVDPGSGTVPALVSGRLASPPPAGATVLVAVNGRIGGEARLFPERPDEPAVRFAVITPDTLWKAGDGRRQLQLYLVDRGGARPRLQPVELSVR